MPIRKPIIIYVFITDIFQSITLFSWNLEWFSRTHVIHYESVWDLLRQRVKILLFCQFSECNINSLHSLTNWVKSLKRWKMSAYVKISLYLICPICYNDNMHSSCMDSTSQCKTSWLMLSQHFVSVFHKDPWDVAGRLPFSGFKCPYTCWMGLRFSLVFFGLPSNFLQSFEVCLRLGWHESSHQTVHSNC